MECMSRSKKLKNYKDYEKILFSVSEHPVSTFSVDADGGAYANMRAGLYISDKRLPKPLCALKSL